MGAAFRSGIQEGVIVDDLTPLPPPDKPARPIIGDPPSAVNVALEYTVNCSRSSFVKAWIEELASKIVVPGDGVTQGIGFEDQIHGLALSHGAVVAERNGPLLMLSMKEGSNYWTARGIGGFPPIIKGLTNTVEVKEVGPNKIKVRMLGRFQLVCAPIGVLRGVLEGMYNKIVARAEAIERA